LVELCFKWFGVGYLRSAIIAFSSTVIRIVIAIFRFLQYPQKRSRGN